MKKEDINTRLNKVLSQFGSPAAFDNKVSSFKHKLEVLFDTNKYGRLLKSLFSSRERSEFNSYVFEALFAFDFVSNGQELIYETKRISNSDSSIDFCYLYDETKIFLSFA